MPNSTGSTSRRRPRKLKTLSLHKGTGYWYKTIRGRRRYYEHIDNDPTGQKSLEQWLATKDDPFQVVAKVNHGGVTLADCVNRFLEFKESRVESGELARRTFDEYYSSCELLLSVIDKDRVAANIDTSEFAKVRQALASRYGCYGLGKSIQQIRTMFKYAFDCGLLDRPMRYGPEFAKPSAKQVREHRIKKGAQDYTAAEIRQMLEVATPITKAMILLGVNGALGNTDIADLPLSAINLKTGWADYPRAKTATRRRIPLWPETIAALREVKKNRPNSKSEMFFVSVHGQDFREEARTGWRVTGYFRQVLKKIGIDDGRGFYGLRRTFQTQAEECGDFVAVSAIMGHIPRADDMAARYRQRISDERLKRAVDTVRTWLMPMDGGADNA